MDAPVSAKAALLAALLRGSGYGTELLARIEKLSGLRLSQGTIYPALTSLEDEGLIRRKNVESGTRACYYELTAEGRRRAIEHRKVAWGLYMDEGREDERRCSFDRTEPS